MAPISTSLVNLTNPLVTSTQLLQAKNASSDETTSLNFAQSILTNAAGVLLGLPQDVIATSLVLLQRYQITSLQPNTRASLTGHPSYSLSTVSAAIVYATAKLSFTPLGPRSVTNVYAFLTSSASPLWFVNPSGVPNGSDAELDPRSHYVSEGTYERERLQLFAAETSILAVLSFDTRVVLPHSLALTYIQTLGVRSRKLVERTIQHLNGGLLSPQLIYLTHQPNSLAVAAIYLAARDVGIKLVEVNWWEVFDVDREDLGFLVLAFGSLGNFATAERKSVLETGKPVSMRS